MTEVIRVCSADMMTEEKKPEFQVKTRTIRQKRKNGDIYIFERKTRYDPAKKYNVILSSKLIGKIPKGETEIVPTKKKEMDTKIKTHKVARGIVQDAAASAMDTSEKIDSALPDKREPTPEKMQKKKAGSFTQKESASAHIRAELKKAASGNNQNPVFPCQEPLIDMMEILQFVGRYSGIDDAVRNSTDKETADKILSLARFLAATENDTFEGITTWQFAHNLPWNGEFTENSCRAFCEQIGKDDALMSNFLAYRMREFEDNALLAYDSVEVCMGEKDTREPMRLLILYSPTSGKPVALIRQTSGLPDIPAMQRALDRMNSSDSAHIGLIVHGLSSEKTIRQLMRSGIRFIAPAKPGSKWIRKEIEAKEENFHSMKTVCSFDTNLHCVSVRIAPDPPRDQKEQRKSDFGSNNPFQRKLWLHMFYNAQQAAREAASLDRELLSIKNLLENGVPEDDLSERAQKKAQKYLTIRNVNMDSLVNFNEKEIATAKRHLGFLVLATNCDRDPGECLRKYQTRHSIDSFFGIGPKHADLASTWSDDAMAGRVFIRFIALCYHEYVNDRIQKLRKTPQAQSASELATWLMATPVHLLLQWFDRPITPADGSPALNTEERNRRFLEILGIHRNTH